MITAKERAYLKSKLNTVKPAIRIGKEGLKEETFEAIDLYLKKNEIMKIQVLNNSEVELMEMFSELEDRLGAEFVSKLGHILSIYRQSDNRLYL